jgi:hypothetical protein
MHAALDLFSTEPEPLPPPPRRPRLARGSVAPHDLAIDVRVIDAPRSWSRVVPVSPQTGQPLLARDRRPDDGRRAIDRAAPVVLGALALVTAVLAIALVA